MQIVSLQDFHSTLSFLTTLPSSRYHTHVSPPETNRALYAESRLRDISNFISLTAPLYPITITMHTTALFTLPLLLSASLASAQEVVVGGSCDLRLRDTDCNSAGEQLFCSTTMNDDRIRWIYVRAYPS